MASSIDLDRPLRFVNFCKSAKDGSGEPIGFDASSLEGIYDVSAREGAVTCYLRVGNRHRNFMGNLHGGYTGTWVSGGEYMHFTGVLTYCITRAL